LAFERGVPALLLWLLLLGAYARSLWKLHRRLKTTASEPSSSVLSEWIDRGLVLGALGGLAGFFASGLVHYNWGDSEVIMIFYLVMGLALALHALTGDDGRQPMNK
jgi:hypothetical protein